MIEITNLTYSYDDKNVILDDISLSIPDGKIMGLVGINGAGKSTLLRLISGVFATKNREILIDGRPTSDVSYRQELFFLPDDPYFTSNDTCKSLKKIYKVFFPDFDEAVYSELMGLFKLPVKKKIRSFSKGMRRQAYIALAFAVAPKYLLLDEAFDGLDPLAKIRFKNYICRIIKEKGSTVIVSSHSLSELSDFCDEYVMLDGRRIIHTGDENAEKNEFFKCQMAFSNELKEEAFVNLGLEITSIKIVGHVVTIIAKGSKDDIRNKIESLNPLILDELPLNFEEAFFQDLARENQNTTSKGGNA